MTDDLFQRTGGGADVFRKLDALFRGNLESALAASPDLDRVELKARCLSTVSIILREASDTPTRKEVACVYDEVFADCICSIYLAALGLDKPAQLVLRRVLELGVAAVYLWDVPHVYWGWKEHDKDLSFTEMTDQLGSPAYATYIASMNPPGPSAAPVFDVTFARNEYRALSNAVHGKIATFETSISDRFHHTDADWAAHLLRIEAIQNLLLQLSSARFPEVRMELPRRQPQLRSIT